MANIGVELKRLLTKLGGTPSKYDQTNELLHKITDQVNAGGSGGGATIVFCPVTYEGGSYTSTMTAGELFDADIIVFTTYDGDVQYVCMYRERGEYGYRFLYSIESDGGEGTVAFTYLDAPTANDYPTTAGGGD